MGERTLQDIKEIKKQYTREEFIDKLKQAKWGAKKTDIITYSCPIQINLINFTKCGHGCAICEHCWLEAIKDIQFKDEEDKLNIDDKTEIKNHIHTFEEMQESVTQHLNNKISEIESENIQEIKLMKETISKYKELTEFLLDELNDQSDDIELTKHYISKLRSDLYKLIEEFDL